jgi:hypothetical protein
MINSDCGSTALNHRIQIRSRGIDRQVQPGIGYRAQHRSERRARRISKERLRTRRFDVRNLRCHTDVADRELLARDNLHRLVLRQRHGEIERMQIVLTGRIRRREHRDLRVTAQPEVPHGRRHVVARRCAGRKNV